MKRKRIILFGMLCGLPALGAIAAGPPGTTTSSETAGNPQINAEDTAFAASPAGGALPNYVINWYSINGGGAIDAASSNFKMGISAAQSVAGEATSASYKMGIGFWYGANTCLCPCHGDPQCDGISNVQDVVQTVNVAFRGYPPVFDPLCPYGQTDVNCDKVTTVVDVVKMVNVVFRGYNRVTEFCQPCA